MLSTRKCADLINGEDKLFDDKEVEQIRKLFYELAEMDVTNYFKVQQEKMLANEKSHLNDKGQLRRAGEGLQPR